MRSLLLTGSGVGSEKREGLWAVDYGPSTVDYSPLPLTNSRLETLIEEVELKIGF